MPEIRPYAVAPDRLPAYVEALTAMLEGSGPALAPYSAGEPPPQPTSGEVPDDLGLVVSTSGSTGAPKHALLTRANLLASATATHARLAGPGQWLLAMPAHHIAGTQVLIRSIIARKPPILLNLSDGFTPSDLADALAWMPPGRQYTSLVPAQLSRVLEDDGATAALATFAVVLIGGSATPKALLARAAQVGINAVTTYGMSETAGGCVYDGLPLEGVEVTFGADGRITLAGPMVGAGYLGDPERTATAFDGDRFHTDDVGEWRDGRLQVLGRIDDLINTGGLKVAPRLVEEAALTLPEVREAVAVATPHERWGEAVSLAVVARKPLALNAIRHELRGRLPAYALPTRLLVLDQIPVRGPGKPDRAAVAALAGWQNQDEESFSQHQR